MKKILLILFSILASNTQTMAYEEAKAYDDAYEAYELIFNDYSDSKYAQNIELRMARAKAKMTAQ